MAQVRIDDDIYEELKQLADDNERTIGGEIKWLMKNELVLGEIKKAFSSLPAKQPFDMTSPFGSPVAQPVKKRIPFEQTPHGKIYAEAKAAEEHLKEELAYNQDPESRAAQEKEGKEYINELWDAYHEAKALAEAEE